MNGKEQAMSGEPEAVVAEEAATRLERFCILRHRWVTTGLMPNEIEEFQGLRSELLAALADPVEGEPIREEYDFSSGVRGKYVEPDGAREALEMIRDHPFCAINPGDPYNIGVRDGHRRAAGIAHRALASQAPMQEKKP